MTVEGRIYVPAIDSLCGTMISLFHDIPESGHFGGFKTTELVSRDFYWPVLDSSEGKCVSGCEVWHRIKAPRHASHGMNMPLERPSRTWECITMDFVTDLPETTAPGYTAILVIVNWLMMMAINLPWWKDIDLPELAWFFFEHVICKCDFPDNIVTDRIPSLQADSRPWYVVTWVLTIGTQQPSIHRQKGRQSVKIRWWSSISGLSATTTRTIGSNSCR